MKKTIDKKFCVFSPFMILMVSLTLLLTACGGNSSHSSGSTGGAGNPPVSPPANAKEWTWISGNNTAAGAVSGVYGTEGVAAAGNIPGGRFSSASWTDRSGNLWLFGGQQVDPLGTLGPLNDLWKFDPASKEWAWVSGSSTVPGNRLAIYGTQGVAAAELRAL